MNASKKKLPRGRPPKFTELRKPVTVTLPERTLQALESISADRARAIVKAVDAAVGSASASSKLMDVVEVLPGKGLIFVAPSRYLKKIPWLGLVEIAPTRYLLTIPTGTPLESLEVSLLDLLEHTPEMETRERSLVEQLRKGFSEWRRTNRMVKVEIVFVSIPP